MFFDCAGWQENDYSRAMDPYSARTDILKYRCALSAIYLDVFDLYASECSIVGFEKNGKVCGFEFQESILLGFSKITNRVAMAVSSGYVLSPGGAMQEKASFDFIVSDECDKRATLRFNKFDYNVLLDFLGFHQTCECKALIETIYAEVLDKIEAATNPAD